MSTSNDLVSREELGAIYWPNVQKNDGCWAWIGKCIPKDRRGLLHYRGRRFIAPRLAWYFATGEHAPKHLFVCHSCDNPNCVNPDHLWLGTNRDNAIDSARKGRNPMHLHPEYSVFWGNQFKRPNGEAHGSSKLTWEAVRWIRQNHIKGDRTLGIKAMAKKYGVNPRAVFGVIHKITWREE